LTLSGCFRIHAPNYPSNWPELVTENTNCPNLEGLYYAEPHTVDLESKKIHKIATKSIGPVKKSIIKNQSCLEESEFCKKNKVFIIEQKSCKDILQSRSLLLTEMNYHQTARTSSWPVTSFNNRYIEYDDTHSSSGGSYSITRSRAYARMFKDKSGALVKNTYRYVCGVAIIPPVPICYAGSLSIWTRYESVIED
jgi:hypothetical protein